MVNFSKRLIASYLFASFLIASAISFIYINGGFDNLELSGVNLRFNTVKHMLPTNNILIVQIDDKSIAKFGQPLPRDIYGYLLEKARENGAKLAAFDIILQKFDSKNIKDLYFLQNISDFKKVLLAAYPSTDKEATFITSDEVFRNYSLGEGVISLYPDKNNIIYGSSLIYKTGKNEYIPSFSAEILQKLYKIENLDSYLSKNYKLYKGKLLINYAGGRNTFPSISISDILGKNFDFSILKDKILLVGGTYAAGQDFYMTPFNSGGKYAASSVKTPGIEVHANILNTLINKNNLIRCSFSFISLIGFASIVIILLFPVKRLFLTLIVALFLVISSIILSLILFKNNIILDTVPILVIIFFTYITSLVFKIVYENLEKNRIKNMFGKYVSPEVVDSLIKSHIKLSVGGESKEISVLFSDIENFTTISEAIPPEHLVRLLNHYFDDMVNIILKYQGTLDKYIGDAIMALYGAPITNVSHADLSVSSAIEMKLGLAKIREIWHKETGFDFNVRIGINSGNVIVGNIGAEKQMGYTAIGDNVNLASRLEGVNKYFGTNIIISEFTYALLNNKEKYILRELDMIRVKGKESPVKIYEVLDFHKNIDDNISTSMKRFANGLSFYREMRFREALSLFEINLNDSPSSVYADRCRDFLENPPDKNWDRVFVMKDK